ncbi:MAG: trypsin-like peptidase domain-containing protein [Deltaproteobacteria bacterium]|nr:trypsin-like peptidase domain-containing protein [Deltaproteobacteria bacterium]
MKRRGVIAIALAAVICAATWTFGHGLSATLRIEPERIEDARARFETERASRADKMYVTGAHIDISERTPWTREGGEWTAAVVSDGARFLRVLVRATGSIEGELTIEGEDGVAHRIEARRFAETVEAWSPAILGEVALLRWRGAASPPLRVVRVAHGFEDLFAYVRSPEKEANCYIDAVCEDDWASVRRGVAYYDFAAQGFSAVCTGALIGDAKDTGIPWFLTAHHCVGNQATAASVQAFWNYETQSCNGPLIPDSQLKSNIGADYMAGTGEYKSDFALLRFDDDPPSVAESLDWSTDAVAGSEQLTVIHHPGGAFKRISHGLLEGDDSSWWFVRYTESSTEGGSSGAPLFNAGKKIVGQLFGGYASCFDMNEIDEYGKLSRSYADGLANYIGPDADDNPQPEDPNEPPAILDDDDDDNDDGGDSLKAQEKEDGGCCGC